MKIILIVGSLDKGGTEKQVAYLAKHFMESGHEIELALLSSCRVNDFKPILKNVNVRYLNLSFFTNPITAFLNLLRFALHIRQRKFDIAHIFLPEAILVGFPIFLLFSPCTVRIAGIRGSIIKRKSFLKYMYKLTLFLSDGFFSNSKHLLKAFEQSPFLHKKFFRVIRNGVSTKHYKEKTFPITDVIIISNFHRYKGYSALINAIPYVNHNLKFHLVGQGECYSQIFELVQHLGISDKVVFEGRIDPDSLLGKCQIAVHPSESEGLSNAILEELSCGLPVIACRIPGNIELITDELNGLLVNPGSSFEIATAINRICSDRLIYSAMSHEAFDSVGAYSWEQVTNEHLTSYQILLEAKQDTLIIKLRNIFS